MKKATILLILSLFSEVLFSQEKPKPEMDGYVRALGSFSQFNPDAFGPLGTALPSSYADYQIHNRLNFRYQPSNKLYFEIGLRNRLFWGYQQSNFPRLYEDLDADMGMADLSWTIWNDNTAMVSVIDRLYGQWTSSKWDIRVGRQRINWGQNTVWNPNDIFNQYNYLDFDYEERRGTDAVNIQYFLSGFKSLELAVAPGRSADSLVAAIRYRFPIKLYDFQVFSGTYFTDVVGGFGWSGSIKNAGFKGEVTYYQPTVDIRQSNLLFSPSIDYSFKNSMYVQLGYLYNENGSNSTAGLFQVSGGQVLEAKNLFPFRSSYFAQWSYPFHPLWSVDFSAIGTTNGSATILIPSISYNWKQNIDLLLLTQLYLGEDFQGDYNLLSNSLFTRISYSF